MQSLLVRADATSEIGSGHVMRCLAIAQYWQKSRGVAFLVTTTEDAVTRLLKHDVKVLGLSAQPGSSEDAVQTVNFAKKVDAGTVIVDGYRFNADYQRTVKDAGLRLVVVDDNGQCNHYYADVILNPNLHANESLYDRRESYTRLFLGTRYALLRREFVEHDRSARKIPEMARKVLVTFGAADPENMSVRVVHALGKIDGKGLDVVVIAGDLNTHYDELRSVALDSPVHIRLERHVVDMSGLMAWADLGISAAGSTSWELAYMGVPSLIVAVSDDQRSVAQSLDAIGAARDLGSPDNLPIHAITQAVAQLLASRTMRERMSRIGMDLTDGKGAARVVARVANALRLRNIREEDCKLLWEWANEPDVRSTSFSSQPIGWEEHVAWFRSKLNDPSCIIYVAMNEDDEPIGQIRYDMKGTDAVVSISIDARHRGLNYGSEILQIASRRIFASHSTDTIHAYVKPGNKASLAAFAAVGFKNMGATTFLGYQATHLTLRRGD